MKKKNIAISTFVVSVALIIGCSHKTISTTSPSATPLPASVSIAQGEKIYKSSCGKCHELKDPADYAQKDWVSIMRSMSKKAQLNEAENNNVTAYVFSLAKK